MKEDLFDLALVSIQQIFPEFHTLIMAHWHHHSCQTSQLT